MSTSIAFSTSASNPIVPLTDMKIGSPQNEDGQTKSCLDVNRDDKVRSDENSLKLHQKQPFPGTRFKTDVKQMPGYSSASGKNLNDCLASRLKRKSISPLKLSRPAIFGSHCAIGTEDPDAKEHWMLITDLNTMESNPIVGWCQPSDHIRDMRWIQANLIVVAADKYVQLYSVKSSSGGSMAIKCVLDGKTAGIHTDSVREMAVSPYSVENILSCGFDQSLCHLDLMAPSSTKRCTRSYRLDDAASSVRWEAFNGQSVASVTLDNGTLLMYDLRDSGVKPVFVLNLGKQDLFTHEHYTENHMLLGYGDGDMKHIDLRATQSPVIHAVNEPFVDCIGTITYNRSTTDARQNSFVVTGLTDVSVWRHAPVSAQNSEFTIWSHMSPSSMRSANTNGFSTAASYWTDTKVVVSTSSGFLQVLDHKFD